MRSIKLILSNIITTISQLTIRSFIWGSLHLASIMSAVAFMVYWINTSRDLFFWRFHNLTIPLYYRIKESKFYMDRLKRNLMNEDFQTYLINGFKLEMDWTMGLSLSFSIFGIIYAYKYLTKKPMAGIRIIGLFLLALTFLLYHDSFFGPLIEEFNTYLISLGYPNFIETYLPSYRSFVYSDFMQHFRLWMGYGNIWRIPKDFCHISFPMYDFTKLDPQNLYGLNNLPVTEHAGQIRLLGNKDVFVNLMDVVRCLESTEFYRQKYNITSLYVIPFLSPSESSFAYLFPLAEYSFGLSLACIIFIISIILSVLYLLNFLTSLKNSDNQKVSPYECGFEPMHTNARIKFDVLYWIIGILYLIFDLEIIFIFPLATILHTLQNPIALFVYLFFIIVLTLGFVYEWKKGALKLT